MPKTQSALLEAMAEHQVTVDGVTRQLPDPFLLIATENPIEYEGTFPLPEAQLDRFFLRTTLGYPGEERGAPDRRASSGTATRSTGSGRSSRSTRSRELRRAAEEVYLDDLLESWIVDLVRATRELEEVEVGASVRGSLALAKTARAWALLHGRDHVLPEDVEQLFIPVLGHRLVLRSAYLAETRHLSSGRGARAAPRRAASSAFRAPRPDWAVQASATS